MMSEGRGRSAATGRGSRLWQSEELVMNRPWRTGLVAGLGVGALVLAWTAALRAQGSPPLTGRIGHVDVGKAFNEYQRMKDILEEIKQLQEKLQAENEQRRQSADALQATVDAMDRNDPAYVKKMAEVLQAKIEHRTWFEVKQAHMTREVALATDRIYRDILKAVEETAQRAGYDFVLYSDKYEPVSMNPDELRDQMRNRRVLYANPAADITQIVLDKLNADYRARPRTQELFVP
jgi:Skp family chaperone for outer membrane proteins